MTTRQNAVDYAHDQMRQGKMTIEEANVAIVRMEGIEVVDGPMIGSVRKALMAAVNRGELGRLKKGRLRPEIFYHPNSLARAIQKQDEIFAEGVEAIKKCLV